MYKMSKYTLINIKDLKNEKRTTNLGGLTMQILSINTTHDKPTALIDVVYYLIISPGSSRNPFLRCSLYGILMLHHKSSIVWIA